MSNGKWSRVTKQLGQVLRTRRNQSGPRGQATGQTQIRQGPASSQGLPLLSPGVWGEQEVESGQLCLTKTDVLWARMWGMEEGPGEREREGGGPCPATWNIHRPSLFNCIFRYGNFQAHIEVQGKHNKRTRASASVNDHLHFVVLISSSPRASFLKNSRCLLFHL